MKNLIIFWLIVFITIVLYQQEKDKKEYNIYFDKYKEEHSYSNNDVYVLEKEKNEGVWEIYHLKIQMDALEIEWDKCFRNQLFNK